MAQFDALTGLPKRYLLLGRTFASEIDSDPNDAAIVSAVIAMSRQLDITTVNEGVETEAQRAFLARLACDEYQGYLFHKPLPADKVLPLLEAHQPRRARSA